MIIVDVCRMQAFPAYPEQGRDQTCVDMSDITACTATGVQYNGFIEWRNCQEAETIAFFERVDGVWEYVVSMRFEADSRHPWGWRAIMFFDAVQ